MSNDNPYASPSFSEPAEVEANSVDGLKIASQGKRFLNWFIDYIIIQALSFPVGFVVGALYASSKAASGLPLTQADESALQLWGILIGIVLSLSYYFITEAVLQRSIAKFVTGTMVVNSTGGSPTIGQILGRTFSRLIPFEAFSFLGGKQPVGWHDNLSGTRVIEVR